MKTMQTTNVQSEAEAGIPNILEVLDGITFPAAKIELVDYAQDQNASEEVLDQLQAMPDRSYRNMHEVSKFIGLIETQPGDENTFSTEDSSDLPDPEARTTDETALARGPLKH